MDKNIDSKTLAIEIAKILDKKKAQDVRVLKVDSLTVLTDYFVIASGTSTTQVGSLADEVEYELSQSGIEPHTTEGFDSKNCPARRSPDRGAAREGGRHAQIGRASCRERV